MVLQLNGLMSDDTDLFCYLLSTFSLTNPDNLSIRMM